MTTSYPQIKLSLPEAIVCKLRVRANRMELTVNAYIRYLLIRFIDRVMWLEFVAKDDPEFVKSWSLDIPLVETFWVAESIDQYHWANKPERYAWWTHPSTIRKRVMKKITNKARLESSQRF